MGYKTLCRKNSEDRTTINGKESRTGRTRHHYTKEERNIHKESYTGKPEAYQWMPYKSSYYHNEKRPESQHIVSNWRSVNLNKVKARGYWRKTSVSMMMPYWQWDWLLDIRHIMSSSDDLFLVVIVCFLQRFFMFDLEVHHVGFVQQYPSNLPCACSTTCCYWSLQY